MVSQASCPAPILDEDLRRHFKDYMCNHRFNPQTYQLNLSNLADDEGKNYLFIIRNSDKIFHFIELSNLGIYPQLNKQAFVRDVVDIINKDLSLVSKIIPLLFFFV